MKKFQYLYLFFFLLIAGCQSLGMEQPKNYDEKEAYALATLAGLRDVAANAVTRGDLSRSEGLNVLEITDNARGLIESARLIHDAGDLTQASTRLSAVIAMLAELQEYLRRAE